MMSLSEELLQVFIEEKEEYKEEFQSLLIAGASVLITSRQLNVAA
jgi:hypothetical protein